jgi:hypothetical protein
VKIKSLLLTTLVIALCSFTQADTEDDQDISLKEITCTAGTLTQLYKFFEDHQYVLVGQGKLLPDNPASKDFHNALFLVSSSMDYFHVVILDKKGNGKYEGCISLSAREIDFQMQTPINHLLIRNNRAHDLFLSEFPDNGNCPNQDARCSPWIKNTLLEKQKPLLTGYEYSVGPEKDPYEEIVELNIDGQIIHPTRGALTELARKKYTLRLTNELDEPKADIEAAKEIYKNILDDVDHRLPLLSLNLTGNDQWKIYRIDRTNGLVWIMLQGDGFAPFPLKSDSYEKFTESLN